MCTFYEYGIDIICYPKCTHRIPGADLSKYLRRAHSVEDNPGLFVTAIAMNSRARNPLISQESFLTGFIITRFSSTLPNEAALDSTLLLCTELTAKDV